jgi:hypothetical protein
LSQSGYIAALLLAAFVLFLAARNRLGTYAAVLWGDTAKPVPKGGSGGGGGGLSIGDIAGAAKTAATFAAVL